MAAHLHEHLSTRDLTAVATSNEVVLRAPDRRSTFSIPLDVLPDLIQFFENTLHSGRRRDFRVPLTEFPVHATVQFDERTFAVKAKDISLTGFGFFRDPDMPDVHRGQQLLVTIVYEPFHLTIDGIARYLSDQLIGVAFPESYTDGELTPPEPLRRLVAEAQRIYIRRARERQDDDR